MSNDDMNEDWIKTLGWDLGSWDSFLGYLGVSRGSADEQREAVSRFMELPAWVAAPADIRARAEALGAASAS